VDNWKSFLTKNPFSVLQIGLRDGSPTNGMSKLLHFLNPLLTFNHQRKKKKKSTCSLPMGERMYELSRVSGLLLRGEDEESSEIRGMDSVVRVSEDCSCCSVIPIIEIRNLLQDSLTMKSILK